MRRIRLLVLPMLLAVGVAWLAAHVAAGYLKRKAEGERFVKDCKAAVGRVNVRTTTKQAQRGIYVIKFDQYVTTFASRRHLGPRKELPIRYLTVSGDAGMSQQGSVLLGSEEGLIQIVDDHPGFSWRDHYRHFYGNADDDRNRIIALLIAAPVAAFVAFLLQGAILRALTRGSPHAYRHG